MERDLTNQMKKVILIIIEVVIVLYSLIVTLLLGGFPLDDGVAFTINRYEWYLIGFKRFIMISLVAAVLFFILSFLNKKNYPIHENTKKWPKRISLFVVFIGFISVSVFVVTKPYL